MDKIKNDDNSGPQVEIPYGLPHEAVSEYFESKKHTKLMKMVPDVDPVGRGPGLNNWRACRDLDEAKEQLKKATKDYKSHKNIMNEKWNELEQRQLQLKEAFEKFNQFVCENEDKTTRAEEKMKEDTIALEKKKIEIEELRKEIDEINDVCDKSEVKLKEYNIYEDYLWSVVKETDFKHPKDIIRHYEALTSTKKDLSAKQEKSLVELESTITDMSRLVEDKKMQIMGANNKLALLKQRHEKAKAETKKWETVLHRLKDETAKRHLEFSRVRESLWMLYQKICKDKGIPVSCNKYDYEGQLITVMRGLVEIKNIVKRAEEKATQDLASDQTQVSSV